MSRKYGEWVKILEGFHKGRIGKVIDEGRTSGTYRIRFDNGEEGDQIGEWFMETIKNADSISS